LQNAVDELADLLFWDYVDTDDEVDEKTNKKAYDKYIVQLHPVEDTQEIALFREADVVVEEEL